MGSLRHFWRLFCLSLVILLSVACNNPVQDDLQVAEHLYSEQRYAEALTFYARFLESHPQAKNADKILLKIGEIQYYDSQDIEKAIATYDKVIAAWPGTDSAVTALESKAALLDKQNDFREIIAVYEALLKYPQAREKKGEEYRYQIGKAYLKLRDYNQAKLELGQMLQEFPNTKFKANVYLDIAEAHFREREWSRAIEYYQTLVREVPDSPLLVQARFNWALALENLGEWSEALRIFESIRGDYPNKEVIHQKIRSLERRRASTGRG